MSSASIDNPAGDAVPNSPEELARRVVEAISAIRFGSVEIVIHDGRVVQIERREKVRLEHAGAQRSRSS